MKIMIVDDSDTFRDALKLILNKNKEYEIVGEAENGIEAIEQFSRLSPDLILMDIEMPEMNGIEATKRILWQNKNIIFIAITMYKDKAYLTELIGSGFKACIFKNNVFDELDDAIKKVCNGELYYPSGIKMDNEQSNISS